MVVRVSPASPIFPEPLRSWTVTPLVRDFGGETVLGGEGEGELFFGDPPAPAGTMWRLASMGTAFARPTAPRTMAATTMATRSEDAPTRAVPVPSFCRWRIEGLFIPS